MNKFTDPITLRVCYYALDGWCLERRNGELSFHISARLALRTISALKRMHGYWETQCGLWCMEERADLAINEVEDRAE